MKNDETAVHRTGRKDMILLLLAVTLVFAMTISSYADQPGEETAETAVLSGGAVVLGTTLGYDVLP